MSSPTRLAARGRAMHRIRLRQPRHPHPPRFHASPLELPNPPARALTHNTTRMAAEGPITSVSGMSGQTWRDSRTPNPARKAARKLLRKPCFEHGARTGVRGGWGASCDLATMPNRCGGRNLAALNMESGSSRRIALPTTAAPASPTRRPKPQRRRRRTRSGRRWRTNKRREERDKERRRW